MDAARPMPSEPVQQPGEDWISFSHRWDASRFGAIRRAQADALNATIGVELRAEAIRDARLADNQVRWGPRFVGRCPAADPF